MVVLSFHTVGIFCLWRQTSNILVRITPSGSMTFHTLYGSRSGPGAEADGRRFNWASTSPGEIRTASYSLFGGGGVSRPSVATLADSPPPPLSQRTLSYKMHPGHQQVQGIDGHSPPPVSPSHTFSGCGGTTAAPAASPGRHTPVLPHGGGGSELSRCMSIPGIRPSGWIPPPLGPPVFASSAREGRAGWSQRRSSGRTTRGAAVGGDVLRPPSWSAPGRSVRGTPHPVRTPSVRARSPPFRLPKSPIVFTR